MQEEAPMTPGKLTKTKPNRRREKEAYTKLGKVVAPRSLTPQSNSKLDNRKFSGTMTAMRELPAVTKSN
jgi:hypothetical protein